MNDIPGLSRPLADAGKRVDSWDDAGGQLVVVASSTVSRSTCPQLSIELKLYLPRPRAYLGRAGIRARLCRTLRQLRVANFGGRFQAAQE